MIYTISELKERIRPVALKYGLPAVYIFGSYARGEPTDESDVDILVDKTGTELTGLFEMGGLFNDLEVAVEKPIDLISTNALEENGTKEDIPWFVENINKEKIKIYGKE
jgi:predicted nucleotidyltransferase